MKQVGILVFGAAGNDLASWQQDFGLDYTVMKEALLKTAGFDTDADDGAADGNMFQFRRNSR